MKLPIGKMNRTFLKLPCVILALNHKTAKEDIQYLEKEQLRDFTMVKGVYKGQKENAYIIPIYQTNINKLYDIARKHRQESILYIDNTNNAELLYCDESKKIKLGNFVEVPKAEAEKQDCYTHMPLTDKYYITK